MTVTAIPETIHLYNGCGGATSPNAAYDGSLNMPVQDKIVPEAPCTYLAKAVTCRSARVKLKPALTLTLILMLMNMLVLMLVLVQAELTPAHANAAAASA
jgi:hypothetical protein